MLWPVPVGALGTVTPVRLRLDEVAELTGGALWGDPATVVDGASIDSRTLEPGQLFVALHAGRDGHEFAGAAEAAGAAACLAEREVPVRAGVVVADTSAALTALGRHARGRLGERVAGITGSVGKTSTKDLALSVLAQRFPAWANKRSFNNDLGVPLTLLGAPDGTSATVVEMGMRGFGHIARLCEVATPTVGIVTAVAMVHTELVGGLDGVVVAKRELVESLPSTGYAVLNADDVRVASMADHTDAAVVWFGSGGSVWAEDVTLGDDLRPRFTLRSDWGTTSVVVSARGIHQVGNALAAAALGFLWGVGPDEVAAGLESAALSPWRMEVSRAASGSVVVNDAYNASPASVEAALRSVAELSGRRRVAVLGTMAELGDESDAEHRRIASVARELGFELLVVAEPAYGDVPSVEGPDDVVEALGTLGPDDVVLVKASRAVGLERVVEALLER